MTKPESKNGLRIIIAGTGRLGVAVLIPLLESHHQVVAVVQNGRRVSRLYRALLPWQCRLLPSLKSTMQIAVHQGIPIRWLVDLNEAELASIKKFKPDLIITCGFSIILPKSVLELPSIGCINVHTAFLPNHRGANPCAHVILAGDKESGVTVHVTEEGIDAGAVLAQKTFTVEPTDTSMDIYLESSAVTDAMITEAINEIERNGFAHGVPQDLDAGTYDPPFKEKDGRIDWSQPAKEIDRLIRAALAYGPAWFEHHGQHVCVAGSTFDPYEADGDPGTVLHAEPLVEIATGQGSITLLSSYTQRWGGTRWPGTFSGLKPGTQLK